MIYKDFTNEQEARRYRDTQRDNHMAASIFTFGKDKYRVKVLEESNGQYKGSTQQYLTGQACQLSDDIEELNRVKLLIDNPDFPDNLDDVLVVAKKLEKEDWFNRRSSAVIEFFDGVSEKELIKIREMINTALQEYESEWNDKSQVEV